MELAEALQNGLVAPRRANLDSFFLQNPLYAEGTLIGTHALAEEGKSAAYASGPPGQKMSYASKVIVPPPLSVHDASKGKGIAQDPVFSPSSGNVGEGHSNPHMGLGNDTTNSGKTKDSVLVIECVALEEWYKQLQDRVVIGLCHGVRPSVESLKIWISQAWKNRNVQIDQVQYLPNGYYLFFFRDSNSALQVVSQGQWLIKNTPMSVFKWFSGPKGPKPSLIPVWVDFPDLPVDFFPWLNDLGNMVGKVMGQKNRGGINPKWDPQVLVEVDISKSLKEEIPIRDSKGQLFHLQKVVYRNLPNACFSYMKQGHLIKDCPDLKSSSKNEPSSSKLPKTDSQGFQTVNKKFWSKNNKNPKAPVGKPQNRFQPLLTKVYDPFCYDLPPFQEDDEIPAPVDVPMNDGKDNHQPLPDHEILSSFESDSEGIPNSQQCHPQSPFSSQDVLFTSTHYRMARQLEMFVRQKLNGMDGLADSLLGKTAVVVLFVYFCYLLLMVINLKLKIQAASHSLNTTMDSPMDDVVAHWIPSSPLLDLDPSPVLLTPKVFECETIADFSPSPKLKHWNVESFSLSKELSPKQGLKKASALTLKKAFQTARGKTSFLVDTAFSTSLVKEDDLKNELNDEFSSQLSLTLALRDLIISQLSEIAGFRFSLEGKVLSKYGTYKIPKSNFGRYMRADLLDRESRHTVTFVVTEIYLSKFVEAFVVNDYVRIEGACVKRAVGEDGGTCLWALYAEATTSVIENAIRSDGTPSYRLTIADEPSTSDRASILFVSNQRLDYQLMVHEVKAKGFYTCVSRNINAFKQLSNTLSVVDATILCPLPNSLSNIFQEYLVKQVSNLGFEKKAFKTLEITSVNSLDVE
ncbi:hypothetical protein L7F22_054974 [Adiantum nelumboides]|nr:hypothetical protein [Adiantum nelumboides]MCO5600858.1 hypothetical protein [Adiantum nelumboides]